MHQNELDVLDINITALQRQVGFVRARLSTTEPTIALRSAEASVGDPAAAALQQMLVQARTQRVYLLTKYQEKHPDVVAVTQQIKELETLLREMRVAGSTLRTDAPNPTFEQLQAALVPLETELQASLARRTQLLATNDRLRRLTAAMPTLERDLAKLRDEQAVVRKMYDDLLIRQQALRVNQSYEESSSTGGGRFQVRRAGLIRPMMVWPNRKKWLAAAFLAGFLIGLGFVLLAEYLDRSVRSTSELRKYVDAPLVAVLPRAPR